MIIEKVTHDSYASQLTRRITGPLRLRTTCLAPCTCPPPTPPARQQHQLESLVSEATGQPIPRTTAADPAGYGLGVQQVYNSQTGPFWAHEGQAFGARVIHYYFPRTGLLIAVAANSSTITHDDLPDLAGTVYQTLQHAGAIPAS